ncbi:MAG: S-layer homology domain-containing protein, partial [Oscillospiraceae bacterium]|nr:S-layer homology domain-containing protein [Oscillospiraceae bacterium]
EVREMAYLGVVTGVGAETFDPDGQLTREQAATILSRLAEVLGVRLDKVAPTFDDNGSIAPWASEAVGQMQAAGIMSGLGNNQFGPQGPYSWEQSISTLMRIYDMTL